MSNWKQSFDSLQLSQRFQTALKQWESCPIEGLDMNATANYRRLLKALHLILARIGGIDPELYSANTWGNFPSYADNIRNYAEQFRGSQNAAYIQHANEQVDQTLSILRPAELEGAPEATRALTDAAQSFHQKTLELVEDIRTKSAGSKNEIRELGQQMEALRLRIDEANQVVQQQKVRLDQAITEHQSQFSAAQEKRTNDFTQALKGNANEFSQQTEHFENLYAEAAVKRKTEYEAFFEGARKQSDAHLSFIQKREEEVNKIFGAVGTTAFAGNFKTTADNEASAANLWRWIALGLMTAMIAVGGYAFYYSIGHETDWRVFAFRLGTVFVLFVPAVYAANESTKHRERERLSRKIHLELASIDAYLVLLPEDQRNKIKGNLTEKFFGVPALREKMDEVTQKDMFGVLTAVLNNLTKGK